MVGAARFELATPCTPCRCATGLRYAPPRHLQGIIRADNWQTRRYRQRLFRVLPARITAHRGDIMNGDCYSILGVPAAATTEEIRAAYRRLARQYHPDLNAGPEAEARMKEINQAYATLSDPQRRRHYDVYGVSEPPSAGPSRRSQHNGTRPGSTRPARPRTYSPSSPQRGEDIETALLITRREARQGMRKVFPVARHGNLSALPRHRLRAGGDPGGQSVLAMRRENSGCGGSCGSAPPYPPASLTGDASVSAARATPDWTAEPAGTSTSPFAWPSTPNCARPFPSCCVTSSASAEAWRGRQVRISPMGQFSSRARYCSASARCAGPIRSAPARSATVRATLTTRCSARAERSSCCDARCNNACVSSCRSQWSQIADPDISAFESPAASGARENRAS